MHKYHRNNIPTNKWSVNLVHEWFTYVFDKYGYEKEDMLNLLKENDIDGETLLMLTEDHIKDFLKITSLGKRLKILSELKMLKEYSIKGSLSQNLKDINHTFFLPLIKKTDYFQENKVAKVEKSLKERVKSEFKLSLNDSVFDNEAELMEYNSDDSSFSSFYLLPTHKTVIKTRKDVIGRKFLQKAYRKLILNNEKTKNYKNILVESKCSNNYNLKLQKVNEDLVVHEVEISQVDLSDFQAYDSESYIQRAREANITGIIPDFREDIELPLYGESEYDSDEIKDLLIEEEEDTHKVEEMGRNNSKQISKEAINKIIDNKVVELKGKWNSKHLPKLEARRYFNYLKKNKSEIIKNELNLIKKRISNIIDRISHMEVTSTKVIKNATRNIEVSLFTQWEYEWLLSLFFSPLPEALNKRQVFKTKANDDVFGCTLDKHAEDKNENIRLNESENLLDFINGTNKNEYTLRKLWALNVDGNSNNINMLEVINSSEIPNCSRFDKFNTYQDNDTNFNNEKRGISNISRLESNIGIKPHKHLDISENNFYPIFNHQNITNDIDLNLFQEGFKVMESGIELEISLNETENSVKPVKDKRAYGLASSIKASNIIRSAQSFKNKIRKERGPREIYNTETRKQDVNVKSASFTSSLKSSKPVKNTNLPQLKAKEYSFKKVTSAISKSNTIPPSPKNNEAMNCFNDSYLYNTILYLDKKIALSEKDKTQKIKEQEIQQVLSKNPIDVYEGIYQLAQIRARDPSLPISFEDRILLLIWEDFMFYMISPTTQKILNPKKTLKEQEKKVFLVYFQNLKRHYLNLDKNKKTQTKPNLLIREKRDLKLLSYSLEQAERVQQKDNEIERLIEQIQKEQPQIDSINGEFLINPGHSSDILDVRVPDFLSKNLKFHQKEGVRFLWRNIIMKGNGCILAHSMGLGKTLQIITFIYTLLFSRTAKSGVPHYLKENPRILILCPLSVKQNWANEFDRWIEYQYRFPTEIFVYGKIGRDKIEQRVYDIKQWYLEGGIMIMNYSAFREILGSYDNQFCDGQSGTTIKDCLLNPGPDLVIADEGHVIKNSTSQIYNYVKEITTPSKICLSGYPIQNNLNEFWCMIDFVYPTYLSSENDFKEIFEIPIENALYYDSTESDRLDGYCMLLLLVDMLKNIVLRRDSSHLDKILQPKKEFLFACHLSPMQHKIYESYIDFVNKNFNSYNNFFSKGQILSLICNHPQAFKINFMKGTKKLNTKLWNKEDNNNNINDNTFDHELEEEFVVSYKDYISKNVKNEQDCTKLSEIIDCHFDIMDLTLSNKFKILTLILTECSIQNEKVVIYSQSLITLSLIEDFFNQSHSSHYKYLRLDGSVPLQERENMIQAFNEIHSSYNIFLISITAGSMGINLTAANHVVLFDVGWNPSYAQQAVGRVYRIGQSKKTYVYRLYAYGTWEEVLVRKSEVKESLSNLVIDKKRGSNLIKKRDLKKYFVIPPFEPPIFKGSTDEFGNPIVSFIIDSCKDKLAEVNVKPIPSEDENLVDQFKYMNNGYFYSHAISKFKPSKSYPNSSISCKRAKYIL